MGSEAGGGLLTLLLTLHASLNFPGKEQSVPFRFGPLGVFPAFAKRKGELTITELTSDVCGGVRLTQDCPSQRKTVPPYRPRPTLPDFLLCSVSTKQVEGECASRSLSWAEDLREA